MSDFPFNEFLGILLLIVAGSLTANIAKDGIQKHEHWPLAVTLVMGAAGALLALWKDGQHFLSWFLTIAFTSVVLVFLYVYVRRNP